MELRKHTDEEINPHPSKRSKYEEILSRSGVGSIYFLSESTWIPERVIKNNKNGKKAKAT